MRVSNRSSPYPVAKGPSLYNYFQVYNKVLILILSFCQCYNSKACGEDQLWDICMRPLPPRYCLHT